MQCLRHVSVSCDNDLVFSERYFWSLQKHFLESLRILGKRSVFPIFCCIPKLCKAKTYHDKRFDTKNKVRKSFSMSYRYVKLAGIGLYHCLNERDSLGCWSTIFSFDARTNSIDHKIPNVISKHIQYVTFASVILQGDLNTI